MKRAFMVDDEENAACTARLMAVTVADMEIQFAGTPANPCCTQFRPDVLFLDVEDATG